eukprot:54036_1
MSSSSYNNNRLTKKERDIINRQAAMAAQRQSQQQNANTSSRSRPRPPPPSRIRNVKSKAPTSLSELLGGPPRKPRPPPPPKHVPKRAINTSRSTSTSISSASSNSRNNNVKQSNVRPGIRARPTITSKSKSNDGFIDLTKDEESSSPSPEKIGTNIGTTTERKKKK